MSEGNGKRNFDEEYDFTQRPIVEFVLGGVEMKTKPIIHPKVFLKPIEGLEGIVAFVSTTLDKESREKFQALLDDEDALISGEQVSEVASHIIAELSPRPTEQPDSSGSGEEATS